MRPFHAWNQGSFQAYPVLNFYTDWAKSLRKASEHGEEEAFDLNAYADINLYDGEDDGQAPTEAPAITVRTNSALGKALFTIGSYMMFHCGQNYESSLGANGRIESGNKLVYRASSTAPDPMRNEDGSPRMCFPEGTRASATPNSAKQTAFEDIAASPSAILFGARGSDEKLFPFNPEVVMKLGGMVRDILQALCTSFEDTDENDQPTWAPLEFPSPNALPAMVEKDRRELITRRLSLCVAKHDENGERVFDRAGTFGPWKMFYDATPSATNAKGRLQARVVEQWAQAIDKALGGSASRSRFNAQGATTLEFPLDKGVRALDHVNALTFANDATPVTALVQLQAQVAEQTKGLRGSSETDELREAIETYALSHLWEVALSLPANVEKQLETYRLTAAGRSALPSIRPEYTAAGNLVEVVKKSPLEMALFGLLGSVTLEAVATKLVREAKNQKAQEPKIQATELAMFALLSDMPNRVLVDKTQPGVVLGKVSGLQALLSIGTFATKFGVKPYTGIRSEYGAVASYYLAKAIDAGLAKDHTKSPSEVLKGILKASPVLRFFREVWALDEVEAKVMPLFPVDYSVANDQTPVTVEVDINALPELDSRLSTRQLLANPGDYAWAFVQVVEKLADPKERAMSLSLAMAKAARNSFKEMTKELSKENLRRLYEFSMYRFPAPGKAASSSADNFRHSADLLALHKALLDAKGQQGPVANVFQVVVAKEGKPKFEVVPKALAQLAYEHYSNARTNKGRSDGLLMAIISESFEKAVSCVEGLYGLGLILESPDKLNLFDGDTLGCIAKADGTGFFVPLKLGNNEEGRYIERVAIKKTGGGKVHLTKELAFGVPVSVYVDKDGANEYTEEKVGWLVGSNRLPAMASCGYVVMETGSLYDASAPTSGLHLFDKATDKLDTGTRFSPWAVTLGSKDNGATLGSVLMASRHWLVGAYDELGANGKGLTALPRFLAVAEDFVPGLVEEYVADVGILSEELYKEEALDLVDGDGNPTISKEGYVKDTVIEYLENAGFEVMDFYPADEARFDIVGTFKAINEEALALMGPFHAAAVRALFPDSLHFQVSFNRKGVLRASHLSEEGLKALLVAKEEEAKEAAEEAALVLSQNGVSNV
jgi:hypothetical protein